MVLQRRIAGEVDAHADRRDHRAAAGADVLGGIRERRTRRKQRDEQRSGTCFMDTLQVISSSDAPARL
jgi:hypothetical protein